MAGGRHEDGLLADPGRLRMRPGDQALPTIDDSIPIQELVIVDIRERMEVGKARYGTYLQADNGRDALLDAYQEAMDLTMYLKQELVRQDERRRLTELVARKERERQGLA